MTETLETVTPTGATATAIVTKEQFTPVTRKIAISN